MTISRMVTDQDVKIEYTEIESMELNIGDEVQKASHPASQPIYSLFDQGKTITELDAEGRELSDSLDFCAKHLV